MQPSCAPHQLVYLTLQVVYTVQFPLAAALRSVAVLTAPSHVVDEVQLLPGQTVLLQHLLELIPAQRHQPLHSERQLDLDHRTQGGRTSGSIVSKGLGRPPL